MLQSILEALIEEGLTQLGRKAIQSLETHTSKETPDNCTSEQNTITIEMEDGSIKDFIVLDVITHVGKQYMALAVNDSMEYDIMGWEVDGENVELSVIEDDDEFNAVAKKIEELFQSYDKEQP